MIIINRLSLPTAYQPKVGDVLRVTKITGGKRGRWYYDVEHIKEPNLEKRTINPGNMHIDSSMPD